MIRNFKRVSGLLLVLLWSSCSPAADEPDSQRQQELDYMLRHDCGSCHGMSLKGGLGPALLADELSNKGHTVDSLSLIIRHGRPGTAMPPWGPILAEPDIRWIAARLLQPQP